MIPLIPLIAAIAGGIATTSTAMAVSSSFTDSLRDISINEGYQKASREFEKKYRDLYEEFMAKEKTWEKNKEEYEDIIRAYKEFAEELRRENEDLKKNGATSESAAAVGALGTTYKKYGVGLDKEVDYYEECLTNLRNLKENG